MKRILTLILLINVVFCFSQNEEKKDIKVGLVLSGGGAKGFAHVAALKVIEEAGVRVDYIGGTSMGAIVGALYASGYTADQLDSIVRTINFSKILTNDLPRKSKPFYEKEAGENYSISLPIKNRKIGIPKAISEGQNVLNLLTSLTQHVNNINDFSKLPIPFICIATDLATGKQEVLKSGFLPEAVKASSSYPTLLAPVEIDGKLLSDGGIVNNFPVEEVIAMGADVIIGIDIQGGLSEKENLISGLDILNQIVGFQMYNTLASKHNLVDVLIKPKLDHFNVISFSKTNEIMLEGEIAARQYIKELEAIANAQIKKDVPKLKTSIVKKYFIKRIHIEGNNNYTRAYVLGKLNLNIKNATSYKSLIESINNLTATGNFESIEYQLIDEKDGVVLKLNMKENLLSNFLQLGIHYDNLYKTGVLLNITSKHVLNKNDVISTDIILGDNLRYNFNYFVDNGFYWSFGFKSRYNSFNANVNFEEGNVNKINLVYEDFSNLLYFQTVFSRKFAFGLGAEHKRVKAFTETITSLDNSNTDRDKSYFDKSNYFNLITYFKIDTYDKKYFQKRGFYLDSELRWYLASSDYPNDLAVEHIEFKSFSQFKSKFGMVNTLFNKLTGHYISEVGITMGDNSNRALDYNLGSYGENFINNFIPFYGYSLAELNSNSFLKSTFTLRYEFIKKNYISATANYARFDKDLFNKGKIFENTKSGYLLGYGLDTFIGPIELNYTWSPDHKQNYWYFNVGFWF
ncbi:patatin-like phospholipase family protein [Lutibacter sp.]|uniref:patatin-like phospholipase family protein n=1 Tax=Lutibacter sp. TaxID=1925666 RepID=UPI002734D47A|nr:patatin-like phospholipase family protein [Lutibacter sp.]MDP3312852.1 patatin-like phospholipase family protein [Lutibacter sp.]